jgi:DUF4097 and DUF4098 domain-containing protein YvlB
MIDQRFDTPDPVHLQIKLPIASLEVTTVDGGESTVTVMGSERMLEGTKVELSGNRLAVEMQRKLFGGFSQHFKGEDLKVRVTVPHHSRVDVVSAAGDADLNGTFARLELKTVSGEVRVAGEITGDAIVQTVSGDSRLPYVGGDLKAQTVSGSVRADSVNGSVSMKSVSGDVRVDSVREGKVHVQSVSGDVAVGIAAGTNVDVDAKSASGTLSSEVPLAAAPGNGNGTGPTVVVRGQTVSGDLRLFRAA